MSYLLTLRSERFIAVATSVMVSVWVLSRARTRSRWSFKLLNELSACDSVVKSGNDFEPAKFMDLNMMVLVSGKERSRLEFEQLLSRSGFKLNHIYNEESRFAILECLPE